MNKKQADGFVSLVVLFFAVLAAVGILALIKFMQPEPVKARYAVGDCIQNTDSTEIRTFFKVVRVTNKTYLLLAGRYAGSSKKGNISVKIIRSPIAEGDEGTEKVECPKELNDPKTLETAYGQ